jgi:hypothetical protein
MSEQVNRRGKAKVNLLSKNSVCCVSPALVEEDIHLKGGHFIG